MGTSDPEKVALIIRWGRLGLTWQEMRVRAAAGGWTLHWRRVRALLEPKGLWAPTMRRGPGRAEARRWRCACHRCGQALHAYPTREHDGWVSLLRHLLSHLQRDHGMDLDQLRLEESKLIEGTTWDWEQGD